MGGTDFIPTDSKAPRGVRAAAELCMSQAAVRVMCGAELRRVRLGLDHFISSANIG